MPSSTTFNPRFLLGTFVAAAACYALFLGTGDSPRRTERQLSAVQPPRDEGVEPLVQPIDIDPQYLKAVSTYLDPEDHVGGGRAHAHPHGDQVCASGCAANSHPTPQLVKAEFLKLIQEYAMQPMSEDSPALETLLYYGRQTEMYLDRVGADPLDDRRLAFLKQELGRTHAYVSFRIVDEQGMIRVYLPPTRVALDVRYEFTMDTHELQPLVTSGTVKRVGLYHIWQRI
ncbi:MAG: hypothetical protein MPJ50_14220 [Pirellulales bacterium]|nr:hypothetical protein [Pirellulales bacterium]